MESERTNKKVVASLLARRLCSSVWSRLFVKPAAFHKKACVVAMSAIKKTRFGLANKILQKHAPEIWQEVYQ